MKKENGIRIGLRVKLTCVFLLFGAAILSVTVLFMERMIENIYKEFYNENLADVAETAAGDLEYMGVGAEKIRSYMQSGTVDGQYADALEWMKRLRERFELESVYLIYPAETDADGTERAYWFADASKENEEQFYDEVVDYMDEASAHVREAYERGERSREMDWTEIADGEWVISAYYPMKDAQGNSVAILGVDKSGREMADRIEKVRSGAAHMLFLIVAAAVTMLTVFVQHHIVRPIRCLERGVLRLGAGEEKVEIRSGRRDELGEITRAFNRMAENIGRHMKEMGQLNSAYQKLLPSGVFELLHKNNIAEFQLGDQVYADLTVLAMEPQNAGAKLSKLSSGQTFHYINDMLAQTVPAVLERGGAVWNFDSAAVYSFFQYSVKDALEAALLAGAGLDQKEEGIAAGIVRGAVMVGIAGHEARMNVISISEQSQIAAFFMRIGERYHASVLIGKSAASQIPHFETRYHVRFLGYLRLSSSERLEGVYDVFDGDEKEKRRQKQRTKEDFERGVLLFTKQDPKEARSAFIDVLRQYRADEAARRYLELCSRILTGEESGNRVWFEEL